MAIRGAHSEFISERIIPILAQVVRDENAGTSKDRMSAPLSYTFLFFIAAFLFVRYLLPDTVIGNVLAFLAFPALFIASLAGMVFVFRQRFAEMFAAGHQRFLLRTRALHEMAEHFGLDYVPLPGGPSPALKTITGWRFCPQVLKDMYAVMDDHGGFDDISDIVRASGLTVPGDYVLGSEEQKAKYYTQATIAQQFEDGFRGKRSGVPFAALEWTESGDDTKTHHFMIALKLPVRLTGRVEFKTRKALWPAKVPGLKFEDVKLVSKDFRRNFKVRATDQMEARLVFDPAVIARLTDYAAAKTAAQTGDEKVKIRGSAFDTHLVVDFIGDKRFDLVDLMTGEWDETRIAATLADFEDMLAMVDGIATVFNTPQEHAA